jgi:hypothetical protein
MRIRIVQSCAGNDFTYARGRELEYGTEIPKDRAMQLLNGGLAVPVREVEVETADEPVHIGAGWYRLPDGRKIRGKVEAAKAMEE